MRHLRLAALSLVFCLLASAQASAITRVFLKDPYEDGRFSYAAEVNVLGDGTNNRIRVHWSERHHDVVIRDSGRVTARQCHPLSRKAVRCPFRNAELWVDGQQGQDYIRVGFDVPPVGGTVLDGGPSSDVVVGGAYEDFLNGGDGDDVLIGRRGDDDLYGDFGSVVPRLNQRGADTLRGGRGEDFVGDGFDVGRDKLLGGRGPDDVLAADFSIDARIDCGPGRDTVDKDRNDPRATDCEEFDSVGRPAR